MNNTTTDSIITTDPQQAITPHSDTGPKVDIDRIRSLIQNEEYGLARRFARAAVNALTRRDEDSLLVEALTLYGIVLARLGSHSGARIQLERANQLAKERGDIDGQCRAELTIIQEMFGQTSTSEIVSLYSSAMELSQQSADPVAAHQNLVEAFRAMVAGFQTLANTPAAPPETWEGFSLKNDRVLHERALILKALKDAGGSVTAASRLLGFRHHQSLISVINSRHQELLTARSTVRKRRHHIIASSKSARRSKSLKNKASAAGAN